MIEFKLNGKPVHLKTSPERKLLWVIRSDLGLTGTKYGCGQGFCGTCTVLIKHQAVRSCVYPISNVQGKEVMTIEGLSQNGELHPLQKAFMEENALQCGFCTPGMILTAYGFLLQNPNPSREQIISAMDQNLCRCGSYQRIIQAVQTASQTMVRGGVK